MRYLVEQSKLEGHAKIPGSKSATARGLVLGTLAKGVSHIQNPHPGIDSYSIVQCCRALGAKIDTSNEEEWIIEGTNMQPNVPKQVLDVGNSGTGYYLLTAASALISGKTVLSGDYQICYRKAGPLINAINQLGGYAISTRDNGLAPLLIKGRMKGGHVSMPGENMQLSMPLMLVCCLLESDTLIEVQNAGEHPYIHITQDWVRAAGADFEIRDYKEFHIPGRQSFSAFTKKANSDWCGATYPMVAAAISDSRVTIDDMDMEDPQGERQFVDIIRAMGGKVEVFDGGKGGVVVEGGNPLHGIEIDCLNMPDAIPALAVLGSSASGKMVLHNIRACRLKETDRAQSIIEELTKMGGKFEQEENSMTIYPSQLHGATINARNDHRIVMATTCAAISATGSTLIDSAECVGVSFPRFYEVMTGLGAKIERLDRV